MLALCRMEPGFLKVQDDNAADKSLRSVAARYAACRVTVVQLDLDEDGEPCVRCVAYTLHCSKNIETCGAVDAISGRVSFARTCSNPH